MIPNPFNPLKQQINKQRKYISQRIIRKYFQGTYLSSVLASTDCSAIERKGETFDKCIFKLRNLFFTMFKRFGLCLLPLPVPALNPKMVLFMLVSSLHILLPSL